MKISPIVDAIKDHNRANHRPIDYFIVHTGQHYDQGREDQMGSNLYL